MEDASRSHWRTACIPFQSNLLARHLRHEAMRATCARPAPSGKLPPGRDSAPSSAPSCGRGAAPACRRDAASRRERRRPRPSRVRRPAHKSPSRFAIAAGRCISVEPSGRPQTARNCCSNWLVTQASTVRWPELCGRGASSLIKQRPIVRHEKLDAQHAHHVQLFQDAARQVHGLLRDFRRNARRGDRHVQDMPAVLILDGAVSARTRRPRRARPPPKSRARNR